MTTSSAATNKMIGVLTQLQKYPDLKGLETIKSAVNQIAKQHDEPIAASIEQFMFGLTHDRNDRLDQAVHHYELSIALCDESQITLKLLATILIGSICSEQDNYQRSYQMFDTVIAHSHLLDGYPLSLAYTNISGLYCNMKLYIQAIDIGHRGIENSKAINTPYNQAICLLNIGYAHAHLNEVQLAIVNLTKAINIGIEIDNARVQAIGHTYLTHAKVQDTERYTSQDILTHFELAEKLYRSVNVNFNRIENALYWAKYLESIDSYTEARQVLDLIKPKLEGNDYGAFQRLYLQVEQKLLTQQDEPKALIASQNRAIEQLSNDLDLVLTQQSEIIANAVQSTRQEQAQLIDSRVYENLGTINAIGQYVATAKDLDNCLPQIYEQVANIFPATEFGIAIYDEQAHTLDYRYFYSENGPVRQVRVDTKHEKSLGSYSLLQQQTVHLNIVTEESISPYLSHRKVDYNDRTGLDNCDLNSVIITPIMLGNRPLGILSVQHKEANQYQQHHCRLFEQLASFIAVALSNRQQRSDLEQANIALDRLSKTDPLTGLFNRYSLDTITPKVFTQATSQQRPISMVIIDIDYYKSYNDYFGHQQGDHALQYVAEALSLTFNATDDYLFRYGGDEFLLLSLSYSAQELEQQLTGLASHIKSLQIDNPSSPVDKFLTLSCGGAFVDSTQPNIGYDHLFNLADSALYKVKAQSRNGFSLDIHQSID
ncbi:sensor domain-containing diguanylate cyclase [Vibrio astriarenae]|uniref:sensor domain-containing diguanylate cyclase n=1 Tax=Vibrio astriarenae TaxID=1481923 RepID=UPI00373613D9